MLEETNIAAVVGEVAVERSKVGLKKWVGFVRCVRLLTVNHSDPLFGPGEDSCDKCEPRPNKSLFFQPTIAVVVGVFGPSVLDRKANPPLFGKATDFS